MGHGGINCFRVGRGKGRGRRACELMYFFLDHPPLLRPEVLAPRHPGIDEHGRARSGGGRGGSKSGGNGAGCGRSV